MRATLLILIVAASVASAKFLSPSARFEYSENVEAAPDMSEFTKGFLEGAFEFVDMNSTKCANALKKGFTVLEEIAGEIMEDFSSAQAIITKNLPKLIVRMGAIRSSCDNVQEDVETIVRFIKYAQDPMGLAQLIIAFGLNPLYYPTIIGDLSSIAEGVLTENWHDAGYASGDLFKGLMASAP